MVFGSDRVQLHYVVNVMEVDLENQRVKLQTGQSQGMRKGVEFFIYPSDLTDFTQIDQRLVIVEIIELGATSSWAKITSTLSSVTIEQGFQAVLLDTRTISLYRKVRFVFQDNLPLTIDQDKAWQKFQKVLEKVGKGFVVIAEGEQAADYYIVVNADREYEIWDSGNQLLPNLYPVLRIDDSSAAEQVVQRLVHLTKYHNILQIDNNDSMSPLAGQLRVELAGMQLDYDLLVSPKPQPFHDSENTPTLNVGDWVFVRIKNNSLQVLNITVLGLQIDWSIVQVYPQDTDFWPFDPGEEKLLPLQVSLPSGCRSGTDIIKVFATVEATSFRWLELPALGQLPTRKANIQRKPINPLEEFLIALNIEEQELNKRNINPVAYPSRAWVTEQVEVNIN